MDSLLTLTLLEWTKNFLLWYGFGIITIILWTMRTGELRVKDINEALGLGLLGPLLPIGFICSKIIAILSSITEIITNVLTVNKDMVLWRSKKKRNEHILFGDKDNDDRV